MQSVPITTKVVSSNPVHFEVYSIQHVITFCQWLVTGRWISPGTLVSSTNKYDITEILLKVALNTITITPQCFLTWYYACFTGIFDVRYQCEFHALHSTWPFFEHTMQKELHHNVRTFQKQIIFHESEKYWTCDSFKLKNTILILSSCLFTVLYFKI